MSSKSGAGTTLKGPSRYIAFGFCVTRSDGVDPDLARRKFERQSPVSVSMAPFVEAYSRAPATGCEPTIELRLMMLPPSVPNRLIASCTVRITPDCVLALLLSSVLHGEVWQKGEKLSLSRLLEELGQIRETLVIYPRRKGQHRPSTANCLTRMSPLQRRLFSLLDLQRYAKGVLTQSN
jgi:hypothetical protein